MKITSKTYFIAAISLLIVIAILNSSCAIFRRCDAYTKKEEVKTQMDKRNS